MTEGLCETLRHYHQVTGSGGSNVLLQLWEGMSEQLGVCFDCINAFHGHMNVRFELTVWGHDFNLVMTIGM